jgi:hypothetical protein
MVRAAAFAVRIGVRMIVTVGIQSGHIRQLFYWRLHGKLRGGIKRWIMNG